MTGRHCNAETCVLDVLEPVFGKDAGNIAMNYTCFPMDCDVASEQARKLVKRINEDGLSKDAALAEVQAEIDADFASLSDSAPGEGTVGKEPNSDSLKEPR